MTSSANRRETGALSGLLTGVTFVGALGGATKLADARIPRPGADADTVRKYWGGNAKAVRFASTGQLISVALLTRFTRSVVKMAKRANSRPLAAAAVAGGGWAAVTLANAAVTQVLLTGKAKDDDEKAVKMARRVFVSGGPVHGVGFGVLTAALALAGKKTGDLPKPVVVAGLVSAGSGIASPLYLRWEKAGPLIPLGRFSGYLISGIAGVRLAFGNR